MTTTAALPPPHLRDRVHGSTDPEHFYEVGERCARDVLAALKDARYTIYPYANVLDFGCGCGRVMPFMQEMKPQVGTWSGVDTDAEAIAWCQEHLPLAFFYHSPELPPLAFPDRSFDLVYGISVFTHLDLARQRLWLAELRRVLRPGGALVLSLHGEHVAQQHVPAWTGQLTLAGHLFFASNRWPEMPDWYGVSFHSEAAARGLGAGLFSRSHYTPRGLNDDHDLLVLVA